MDGEIGLTRSDVGSATYAWRESVWKGILINDAHLLSWVFQAAESLGYFLSGIKSCLFWFFWTNRIQGLQSQLVFLSYLPICRCSQNNGPPRTWLVILNNVKQKRRAKHWAGPLLCGLYNNNQRGSEGKSYYEKVQLISMKKLFKVVE